MEKDNEKKSIIENLFNTELHAKNWIAGSFAWTPGGYKVSVLDLITEEEYKHTAETIYESVTWLDVRTKAILDNRKEDPPDETPRWRHMEQLEQIHRLRPLWVGDLISKDMARRLSEAGLVMEEEGYYHTTNKGHTLMVLWEKINPIRWGYMHLMEEIFHRQPLKQTDLALCGHCLEFTLKDLFNAELITEDDNGKIVLTDDGKVLMGWWTEVVPKHGFC